VSCAPLPHPQRRGALLCFLDKPVVEPSVGRGVPVDTE
jgi:hypothetical protein